MVHFWLLASKRVICPAPLLPAMRFFHVVSTSPPSGVTRPRPVTTTRRMQFSDYVFQKEQQAQPVRAEPAYPCASRDRASPSSPFASAGSSEREKREKP